MSYYILSGTAWMPTGAEESTNNILDTIVDTENNRVEFHSGDGKKVISLDLICANALADMLRQVVGSKKFQTALAEKTSEYLCRHNTKDRPVHL